jgi:hypothetical protein
MNSPHEKRRSHTPFRVSSEKPSRLLNERNPIQMRNRKVLSVAAAGALGLGMLAMSAGTAMAGTIDVGTGSAAAPVYGAAGTTCLATSAGPSGDTTGSATVPDQVACVPATETLAPGTLYFNSVTPIAFNETQLSGVNQSTDNNPSDVASGMTAGSLQTIALTDATGSDAGWFVSLSAPNLILGGDKTDINPQDNLPFANFVSTGLLTNAGTNTTVAAGWSSASDIGLAATSEVVCFTSDANGAWTIPSVEYNQPIEANNTAGTYSAVWTYTLTGSPATLTPKVTGVSTATPNAAS